MAISARVPMIGAPNVPVTGRISVPGAAIRRASAAIRRVTAAVVLALTSRIFMDFSRSGAGGGI